jgi:hypothetical protein
MQQVLDFIHDHTLEQQLFLIVTTPAGDLEVLWSRWDGFDHWHVKPHRCEGPAELIQHARLLEHLRARDADMAALERELFAMAATQIAFADVVLRDAAHVLGHDVVRDMLAGHRDFMSELRAAVQKLIAKPRPSMNVVQGGEAQTTLRNGHLSLVR